MPGTFVAAAFVAVISIKKLNSNIQTKLQSIPPATLEEAAKASVGEQGEGITKFKEEFKAAANSATSAQFALQMTEGVQKVRFVVSG